MQSHLTTLAARSEKAILLCSRLDGSVQLPPTYRASSGSTQHGRAVPVFTLKVPQEYKGHRKIHCHSSNFFRTERKPPELSDNCHKHQHRIPDTGDHVRKKINV